MDHLPQPRHRVIDPIRFPYICGEQFQYDRSVPFNEHVHKLIDYLEEAQLGSLNDPVSFAVNIQKCLFFGLATEFFAPAYIDIATSDFLCAQEDEVFVSTSQLPQLLDRWLANFRAVGLTAQTWVANSLENIFSVAEPYAAFLTRIETVTSQTALLGQTILSVSLLGATLGWFKQEVLKPDGLCPVPGWETNALSSDQWPTSAYLSSYMLNHGWCLSEISNLYAKDFTVVGMSIAAQMKRQHQDFSHKTCTEIDCRSLIIDELTYESLHTTPNCECAFLGVNTEDVCRILKNGGVPVVVLPNASENLASHLQVVDSISIRIPYVALSHVWAHGLGNTRENSLPRCQIEHLLSLLQDLRHPDHYACFWLDTLCIPSKNHASTCRPREGQLSCRKLGINMLRHTYQAASKVLVLDQELQRSSLGLNEENLIRITNSAWTKRLWTLQESILAREVYIQFREKAIHLQDALTQIAPSIHHRGWMEIGLSVIGLRSGVDSSGISNKIASIWNLLQTRTTTNADDEAVCLSVLFESDTSQILLTRGPDRMRKLYATMDLLPSQILFMPGPRLTEPGYGWAPTSFLQRRQWDRQGGSSEVIGPCEPVLKSVINFGDRPAFRSNAGLLLRGQGFLLDASTVLDPEHPVLFVSFRHEQQSGNDLRHNYENDYGHALHVHDRFMPSWRRLWTQQHQSQSLAILLSIHHVVGGAGLAVLLEDCSTEQNVVCGRFVCRLWYGSDGNPTPYAGAMPVQATITECEQMWCVS